MNMVSTNWPEGIGPDSIPSNVSQVGGPSRSGPKLSTYCPLVGMSKVILLFLYISSVRIYLIWNVIGSSDMYTTHSSDCTELHSTANQSEIEHPCVCPTFGNACGYVVKYVFKSSAFFSKYHDLFHFKHFKPVGNIPCKIHTRYSSSFYLMIVLAYGIYWHLRIWGSVKLHIYDSWGNWKPLRFKCGYAWKFWTYHYSQYMQLVLASF